MFIFRKKIFKCCQYYYSESSLLIRNMKCIPHLWYTSSMNQNIGTHFFLFAQFDNKKVKTSLKIQKFVCAFFNFETMKDIKKLYAYCKLHNLFSSITVQSCYMHLYKRFWNPATTYYIKSIYNI